MFQINAANRPTVYALWNSVDAKIKAAYERAKAHYGARLTFDLKDVKVVYDKRGGTAGTAHCDTLTINLNHELMVQEGQKFIDRTPGHELAHLIAYNVFGAPVRRFNGRKRQVIDQRGGGHGPAWQEVMTVIGQDASRCHDYDVNSGAITRKHKAKFVYTCKCGTPHTVGPVLHKKIQEGSTHYVRCCRQRLNAMPYVAVGNVGYKEARERASSKTADALKPAPKTCATSPAPQPKPTVTVKAPAYGTTQARAWTYYKSADENRGNRPAMIRSLVNLLGVSQAHASTLYYNCQKLWAGGLR